MKVAIFTDTFSPQINGVTNTLNKMTNFYDKHGIKYVVFAPSTEDKSYYDAKVERFFSLNFFLYPELKISFPNAYRINQKLKEFNPDIIHNMTEFGMGLTGLNFAKWHKKPSVTTYTTNFAQYTKYYNVNILDDVCWNYMRFFHNQGQVTFCPSKDTQKLLLEKGIKNVKIFSRGIDSDKFNPKFRNNALRQRLNIDDKIVLLYVGRIAPEKDLDILFESYKKIRADYGDKVALVITGDGPMLNKYKEKYSDGIIYTGYKKGRDLSEIYAMADIYTFPSSTETFGNVVIEAMSSGLPIIGVASGGVKDNLVNGYNSIVCSPNDISDFTRGIDTLIKDKNSREKISLNARKYAETKSWDKIFNKLILDYTEIIHNFHTVKIKRTA